MYSCKVWLPLVVTVAIASLTAATNHTKEEEKTKEAVKFSDIIACALQQKECTTGESQVALFGYVVTGTLLLAILCLTGHCIRRRRAEKNKGKIKKSHERNKKT